MKIGYHSNCIEIIIFRDNKCCNLLIFQVFFYSFGKYASHHHHHQPHRHDCAHIERKGKISIETSEKHEKGSDEVVDGRLQIVMMMMMMMMCKVPESKHINVGFRKKINKQTKTVTQTNVPRITA